jgi:hypothetical protein
MEQDEVALVKAIESGDTDLGRPIATANDSICGSSASPKETSLGSVFQGD